MQPPGTLHPCRQQIQPQDSREVWNPQGWEQEHPQSKPPTGHQGERQGHLRLAPTPAALPQQSIPGLPAQAEALRPEPSCPRKPILTPWTDASSAPLAQAGWRTGSPLPPLAPQHGSAIPRARARQLPKGTARARVPGKADAAALGRRGSSCASPTLAYPLPGRVLGGTQPESRGRLELKCQQC